MKKKFLARIFCVLFAAVFALAGCSAGGASSSGGASDSASSVEEEPDPVYIDNPVVERDMADPHILRWEDKLYIYSTGGQISRSDDGGITWESLGTVGISPDWGTSGAGFWAPDIVQIGDKLLLYYSLSVWDDPNPGIGVASAEHPEGPWTDHGKLFTSQEIGVDNSIDPCVFVGQDGNVYMIWGSFRGCYGIELTEDGLGLKNGLDYAKENKVLVSGKPGPWDGSTFEGSYVIYKDGWYYYFGSSGTCCEGLRSTYHVRVGRSQNPLGPYVDSRGRELAGAGNVGDTILAGSGNFVGPGHNSILIDDLGNYYIVYHVWVNDNGEGKGRYLAMSRLEWDDEGWCTVKGRAPANRVIAPYIEKAA